MTAIASALEYAYKGLLCSSRAGYNLRTQCITDLQCIFSCFFFFFFFFFVYRGSIMGFLTSFVKNGEIRSSLRYKIILEQREERNQLNS